MDLNESCWGWHGHHYATEAQPGSERQVRTDESARLAATERRWKSLLNATRPQVQDDVLRAVRQWNGAVRDQLRGEMALRLTVGDEAQAVPVKVVDGLPLPFAQVVDQFTGLEWLLLNRTRIAETRFGAELLEKYHDPSQSLLGNPIGVATPSDLRGVARLVDLLLQKLDEANALQMIGSIQQDVLGAYFFRVPVVILYWLPIGIVALALGVDPEALAVVVLAHELAHAYSHLGRDIDSDRWETHDFAAARLEIVEGVAQFYADVVCQKLRSRFPAALDSYKKLLAVQKGAYTAHTKWFGTSEPGGEIVRVSLIECRSRHVTTSAEFRGIIARHREQVKGRGFLAAGPEEDSIDNS